MIPKNCCKFSNKTNMTKAYLLLGSNMGDREKYLFSAQNLIASIASIDKISSIYQTQSWGYKDNDYLNQVLEISTECLSTELLDRVLEFEKMLGRQRNSIGYSARTIDIDILFFGNQIISTDKLLLPHPRLHLRKFVLIPMMDVNKNFVHPVFNKTIEQLYNECEDSSIVEFFK